MGRKNEEEAITRLLLGIPQQPRPRGNMGRKNKYKYLDCFCAFDIETTSDSELQQAWLYHWQFAIKYKERETVITGRTWPEYKRFISLLNVPSGCRLLVWVENLSFEWQFLKSQFDFQPEDVFATDTRKVLKAAYDTLEYRCSYLQSNMSLELLTETYHAAHPKLSGEDFDYSIMRYPWTELTAQEKLYCYHDVLGLVEAMESRAEGESFYTIPLTSTGYVRRAVKQNMRPCRVWLHRILPDLDTYYMLREAFRGGDTHASRLYADKLIGPVWSFDRASSYPDVQCNQLYPMSAFQRHDNPSIEYLLELIDKRHRATLCRLYLWDAWINPENGFPYISYSKCRSVRGELLDNGRIVYAAYLEIVVTDIDFKIIVKEYNFSDIAVDSIYSARYGKLPEQYTEVIKNFFKAKTELKGIPGMEERYTKSKNQLNAIFGMSVQLLLQESMIYDPESRMFELVEDDPEKLLEAAYRNPFQSYAWGVWTTAHARRELRIGLELAGRHAVYCDTDSVKCTGTLEELEELKAKFDRLNQSRYIKASEASGAYALDRKGVKRYMGVFEIDGCYQQFITLGAKKYSYIQDGKLKCTTAGVSKKYGAEELAAAGGITAYKEGFKFVKAGGTEAIYNDMDYGMIEREGHKLPITSNVCLLPSTYTLGITAEYEWILKHPDVWAMGARAQTKETIFDK